MTHFMRKHKTLIFWMLVLFVGFPMLFFGVDFTAMFSNLTGRDAMGFEPVAVVHGTPITAETLVRELQQMSAQMPSATMEDLVQAGMAEQALDRLINSVLIQKELDERKLTLTDEFVIERMKEEPVFQGENGEFDPAAWNRWVKAERDRNWAQLYEALEQEYARTVLLDVIGASARVLESEIKDEFAKSNTKIAIKYASIDPDVVPTDEQLQETYNEDPDKYAVPGERTVRFVDFSLLNPVPAVASEIIEKARAGEDFAELAKQHSESNKETGGEIGWISPTSAMGTHRESLFNLAVGDVSEPIEGPGGYYIYKVEDERTSEVTQERDISVREIRLAATLSPEETQAVRQKADELHQKAVAAGGLEAAAAELGYELKTTGAFLPDDLSIENVPRSDVFAFKRFTQSLEASELAEVIPSQRNMYVAELATVGDPTPRTFDEAREDVVNDTVAKIRRSPERLNELRNLGTDIKSEVSSVDEIPAKFPDLNAEVKESQPFTVRDMLFTQGISVQPQTIFAAIGDKEPGAFAGPLPAMDGSLYFVQLTEKTGPDETAWEQKYPEEKERIRSRLTMMRENARMQDYVQQLRDESAGNIETHWDVLAEALGLNQSQDAPATETAAEGAPVEAVPVDAASAPAEG